MSDCLASRGAGAVPVVNGGGNENESHSKQLPPYLISSRPRNPSLPWQRKVVIII
jgi:hypothetical protein